MIGGLAAAALYFLTAAALLWIADRWITPLSIRAAVLLTSFPLLFTGRALFTGRVYAPIDLPFASHPLLDLRAEHGLDRIHNYIPSDVYCLNIPWKYAVRVAYSRGEWALWNPFSFAGDILAASAQPTPYEPLFLLSLLLPMANSLTFLAAMTFLLAGLLMFVFLRELRSSELASLAGAATWMFSGFMAFWLEWVITPTMMWLPLVLLGVRRIIRERSLEAAAVLTFAFTMMLLNGHPESALHIVTIGLGWAAAEFVALRGAGFVRATLLATGSGLLALMVTAIYMLPIVEAIPQTAEHEYREQVFAQMKRSVPLEEAIARLESQFIPFIHGLPGREMPKKMPFISLSQSGYAGTVAIALAVFGFARRRLASAALGMIIFGLLTGIEIGPLADWLAFLPLFDIALNGRFVALVPFGFAMLAALGVDAIADRVSARRLALLTWLVAAGFALLIWNAWDRIRASGLSESFLQRESAHLLVPLILLAIAASAFGGRPARLAGIALVLLLAQRTLEFRDFYPTLDAELFYPPIPLFDALPKDDQPYRIVGFGHTLIPNTATMYQLEDIRGYQAMTFAPMKEIQPWWSILQPVWFNRVHDLEHPMLSMMNVRFAVMHESVPLPNGWRPLAEQGETRLIENERVLPRAFVPRHIGIAPHPLSAFGQARVQTTEDFGEMSWISAPIDVPQEMPNGRGTVSIRRDLLRSFRLTADMQDGTWVVVSEMAWKGWRAYIDGVPTTVRGANHAFLALHVPPGKHEILLHYYPHSFVVGRTISLATLLLLAAFAAVRTYRRARPHKGSDDGTDGGSAAAAIN